MTSQCTSRMHVVFRQAVLLIVAIHILGATAAAGPEGATVVQGTAQFDQSGNYTAITVSDRAIINYTSFDIARPETVEFIQPSASASVLNRILSATPTVIDGTILANGRVFFVNPAGVLFGESAQVNVTQLVASALNISDADFTNGHYDFKGGQGDVINRGSISAEQVALIGKRVANLGKIDCPGGTVVLVAGDHVFLGEPGTDLLVEIDLSTLSDEAEPVEGAGVLNEGSVEVGGGSIVLAAAGDVYSQAISNVGKLSASTADGDGGTVKLAAPDGTVINTGSITATSESGQGGSVQVLGDRVGLFEDSQIDVSGATGGGTALVGGDYQGGGGLPTASRTVVGPDAVIQADATEDGDGGKIVVWSDEATKFYGHASAAGSGNGDGGLIEVSGKQDLNFDGTVALGSPGGQGGTLLLDPGTITITDSDDPGASQNDLTFDDEPWDATISEATLERTAAGSNAEIILEAHDNINIQDLTDNELTLSRGVSLVLRTRNDPRFEDRTYGGIHMGEAGDDSIVASGGGSITLQAGHDGQGFVAGSGASISVGSLRTDGGSVTVQAAGWVDVHNVSTAGADNRAGGSVLLEASKSTAESSLMVQGTIDTSGGPDVDGRGARAAGSVTLSGDSVIVVGDITAVGGADNGRNAQGGAGGPVTISGQTSLRGSNVNTSGGEGSTPGVGGAITFNGPLTLTGDSTLTAGTGDVIFHGTVDDVHDPNTGAPAGLSINSGGTTRFDAAVGSMGPLGSLTTDAAGRTQINANITTGEPTGTAMTQTYNDPVTLTSHVRLRDYGTSGIFFNSTVAGDGEGPWNLTVETTDNAAEVQFNDAITVGGSLRVQTAGGDVTFQGTIDREGDRTNSSVSVYSAGTTRFNAAVGGINPIGRVFTDEPGTTEINADITTGGTQVPSTQIYSDPVILTNSVTLVDTGMDGIFFGSTVRGDGQGPWDLTVATTDGQAGIGFGDAVTLDGGLRAMAVGNIYANQLTSARNNIELRSTQGDLILQGNINADRDGQGNGGGVSLIADSGSIYSVGEGAGALDVDIIGYADSSHGISLDPGTVAIYIRSADSVTLGRAASLTARGVYYGHGVDPGTALDHYRNGFWARSTDYIINDSITTIGWGYESAVDDRPSVNFSTDPYYGGVPIDVAIYVRSGAGVNIDSPVIVPSGATVVLDALDTPTLGARFTTDSSFGSWSRLEAVSRGDTAPAGDVTEDKALAGFAGYSYVLRGGSPAVIRETQEQWQNMPQVSPPPVPPIVQPKVLEEVWAWVEPWIPPEGLEDPDLIVEAEGIVGPIAPPHPECVDVKETDVEILRKCQVACDLFSTDASLGPVAEDILSLNNRLKTKVQDMLPRLGTLSQKWPQPRPRDIPAIEQAVGQDPALNSWLQDGVEFVRLLRTKLGRTTNDSVERFLLEYLAGATDESVLGFVQTYLKARLALIAEAHEPVAQAGR